MENCFFLILYSVTATESKLKVFSKILHYLQISEAFPVNINAEPINIHYQLQNSLSIIQHETVVSPKRLLE